MNKSAITAILPAAVPAAGATAPVRPRSTPRSWLRRTASVAALATVAATGLTQVSEAATTYTVPALSATVSGSDVTASVTVASSAPVTAQKLKVCVRTSGGANVDYTGVVDTALTSTGTTYSATKAFPVGTYSYWGCLKVDDRWYDVGTKKSFTVAPRVTQTSLTSAMPTTSSGPSWAYSYGQDFSTSAPLGQFGNVYGNKWAGYWGTNNDTSKHGSYRPDKVLSVANGMLDMAIGYDAGSGLYNVAAPSPQPPAGVNGGSAEYLGMRTSIRFKASTAMPGYKTAWMLWPSSWNWDDGEIDFPESSLNGDIWGFAHQADTGSPELNTLWVHAPASYTDGWHTATTEWIPGKSIEFFLDGVSLGRTTSHVPTKPMHWTLQTETDLVSTFPAKTVSGHLSIDWLTVESYKG